MRQRNRVSGRCKLGQLYLVDLAGSESLLRSRRGKTPTPSPQPPHTTLPQCPTPASPNIGVAPPYLSAGRAYETGQINKSLFTLGKVRGRGGLGEVGVG